MELLSREVANFSKKLRPSNACALAHLATQFVAIGASTCLILFSSNAILWTIGVVGLALSLARNLEIAHALIHQNFFDQAPKWVNRWLGVLLVSPFLMSWSQWRWTHGCHHRRPDIEGFDYPDLKGITGLTGMAKHHLMMPHWSNTMVRMVMAYLSSRKLGMSLNRSVKGVATPGSLLLARIGREYVIVSLLYAAFLASMFFMFSWTGLGCVLLVQLLSGIAHTLIELPEHLFVDTSSKDPLENSYEIVDSPIADFVTFYNTRHASHHMFPEVPIYMLKSASKGFENWQQPTSSNYATFWIRYFIDYLIEGVRYRI